jgi:hypothetical protein
LAGLTARVERSAHLGATKAPVGQLTAVFARERHAEGGAVIDDVDRALRQPMDVRFAGAKVAAFDGVVEQPKDAVAVILVVLGGVDATLRGDAVRTPWRILEAEAIDVVAELGHRRCGA